MAIVSMSDVDDCAIGVTVDAMEFVSIASVDGIALVLESAKIKSE